MSDLKPLRTAVERQIGKNIENIFLNNPDSVEVKLENFPKYVRRQHLKRFLALYEIFKLALPVKGSVVECGVFRGFGLMYHYRVSADGRIWRTQPEELVTWHARAANYNGLAICCDLGPGQTPPQAQVAALKALLDWLCFHRPEIPASRPDVWGHGELHREGNQTACPGHLLEWVQAYRKG